MNSVNNKLSNISKVIFPNKKINIFVVCMLFLGIVAGAIFVSVIGINDKNLVLDKIKIFIDNVNNSRFNSLLLFKNSFLIDLIYLCIIFAFGMSMIGIIFNIILLFIRGFVFGFTIASFILTYSYRGIILSFLYVVFGQIFSILAIIVITIYSIIFSYGLLKLLFKNNPSRIRYNIKNYFLIFIIVIIVIIIASLLEAFIFPALIKLLIKLFK